jgi:hypothetical protein
MPIGAQVLVDDTTVLSTCLLHLFHTMMASMMSEEWMLVAMEKNCHAYARIPSPIKA